MDAAGTEAAKARMLSGLQQERIEASLDSENYEGADTDEPLRTSKLNGIDFGASASELPQIPTVDAIGSNDRAMAADGAGSEVLHLGQAGFERWALDATAPLFRNASFSISAQAKAHGGKAGPKKVIPVVSSLAGLSDPDREKYLNKINSLAMKFSIDLLSYSSAPGKDGVDFRFIYKNEGQTRLTTYTLPLKYPKSGVTVAVGFDLGQRTQTELRNLGVPQRLIALLAAYVGKKGKGAIAANNPRLNISVPEAHMLTDSISLATLKTLESRFDASTTGVKFRKLPTEIQTVLADIAYQYGPMFGATPPKRGKPPSLIRQLWTAAETQNWADAKMLLGKMGFPSRNPERQRRLQIGINRLQPPAKSTQSGASSTNKPSNQP